MATDRATVRAAVQELLGDTNPDQRQVTTFRYNQSIHRHAQAIAARVYMPRIAVQSISLVAGTFEYTSLTATPNTVDQVILNSTGAELAPVPWEQFNAYYRQDSAEPRDSGEPREYTIRESVTNGLVIRVGPTPSEADTLKIFETTIPAALASDATSIPFSDELVRGLESAVAAEIISTASDDRLKALGVARSAAATFAAQSEAMVRAYNLRQGRLGARQDRILRHGGRRQNSGHVFWGWR